ncbi:hypothetical protein AWE51_24185 [Aquimarina aggregata]|uniref:Lipoprotein n=1 Tax=Aquimarina aggregata TaxID=1642818 RepID=A0A163AYX8_9FLAO|nr:hypothetical protein [Aquimarina aggregata]KZS40905.1 hypothetical protein AWE51_24185 [Aquimarina aggregata]
MSYKKYLVLLAVLITITSCHSIKVNKSAMRTATSTPVALGVIGMQQGTILHSDFKETALPTYAKPIRVGVITTTFDKTTFKTYTQIAKDNKQGITYIDSVKTKPIFITLELLDRVSLLSALQKEENEQTIQYVKNQKDAGIVSAVSLALPNQQVKEITAAEAVFLVNTKYKQYQLSLVRDGKSYKTIDFGSATVFAYQLSYFCWGANGKRKIVLSDIVDKTSSCPKSTYRDVGKAKEKMDYFKL